jgi:biopolymer transport protein ExbD
MKLQQKDTEDIELDMSPMIDMVFLLLIFFIVTAQIVDEKPKVTIPAAASAKLPEKIDNRLMITVTKEETFFFRQEEVTIEQLAIRLQENFEEDEQMRILIRADGTVPFKTSEKVMRACAEVGAVDLIFAAFEE